MKFNRLKLLFIPLVFSLNSLGQTINHYSINPKFGFYSLLFDDYAAGLEINTTRNKQIYSIDYILFRDNQFLWESDPREKFNQIGIMYGSYLGEKLFRLQFQGGLSGFWGLRRTDELVWSGSSWGGGTYKGEKFFTIGIPLKLGLKVIPFHFLSFGLDLQANINAKKKIFYPTVSVEIGKIRKKISP